MVKIDSTDEQAVQDALVNMEDEVAAGILVNLLQAKPELAPVLVTVALPDMAYAPSSILTAKRAHGAIKSFNEEKGFGFIDCPQLKELFGRDVFVHGKQMRGHTVGSACSFAIVLNKDNHPQAFDIMEEDEGKGKGGKAAGKMDAGAGKGKAMFDPWTGEPYGKGYDKGYDKGFDKGYGKFDAGYGGDKGYGKFDAGWGGDKGFGKAEMKGWGKPDKGAGKGGEKGKQQTNIGPNVAEVLGQSIGTIKSFSDKNGYGFIDSPEVKELGYQDVFIHHQQMGNFKVGDEVVFTCYLNDKGNPQAKDLMTQADADRAAGGGGGGKASGGKGGGARPGGGPDVADVLGQMIGTLKSFNDKNGYGFISCPEVEDMGHKDVFLHHAQKGDFVVGDEVQFEAYLNKKGQVQARDLAGSDGARAPKRKRMA